MIYSSSSRGISDYTRKVQIFISNIFCVIKQHLLLKRSLASILVLKYLYMLPKNAVCIEKFCKEQARALHHSTYDFKILLKIGLYIIIRIHLPSVSVLCMILFLWHGWLNSRHGLGKPNINGLVQERRNSIVNTLELHLSCTNPSIWQFHTVSSVCSQENARGLSYHMINLGFV